MRCGGCAQHCLDQKVQEDSWGNAPNPVLLSQSCCRLWGAPGSPQHQDCFGSIAVQAHGSSQLLTFLLLGGVQVGRNHCCGVLQLQDKATVLTTERKKVSGHVSRFAFGIPQRSGHGLFREGLMFILTPFSVCRGARQCQRSW